MQIEGLELTGHEFNPFSGQSVSDEVKSRFYDLGGTP